MKKHILLLFTLCFAFLVVNAQDEVETKSKITFYNSGEWIFSLPNRTTPQNDLKDILRFSPWYNVQFTMNYNAFRNGGLFLGLDFRNIGFICSTQVEGDGVTNDIKKKFRTYNFGIPIGLRIGNNESLMVYGGVEIEFPFHYKEKTFVAGVKDRIDKEWASPVVPKHLTSVFGGIELKSGVNLKFKMYLDKFFADSNDEVYGMGGLTYNDLNTQVMYVSLCFNMFHDLEDKIEKIIENRVKGQQVMMVSR